MSRDRSRSVALAAVALSVLALAGCASSGQATAAPETRSPSSPSTSASTVPAEYDEQADAAADVQSAIAASAEDGKPVLLDFGADWCPDCQVLEKLYGRPEVTRVLARGYHLVLVDVGEFDTNLDVAQRYGLRLRRSGIPALVVIRDGGTVYASNRGEFANARSMKAPELLAFLRRWA